MLKQYVKGKSNPEGMKIFEYVTSEGFVINFGIYQGKKHFLMKIPKNWVRGLRCHAIIAKSQKWIAHFLYSYFTTISLIESLLDRDLL